MLILCCFCITVTKTLDKNLKGGRTDYILHLQKCSLPLEGPGTEEQFMCWCPGSQEKRNVETAPGRRETSRTHPQVPTSYLPSLSEMPGHYTF